MSSIYEDRRYVIKCSKCKHIFDYGIEDMRIRLCKIGRDNKGKSFPMEGNFVCCPNCEKEYYFGYESKGVNKVKSNNRHRNSRNIGR